MRDGIRRVTEVTEVVGLEGEVLTLNTLFAYKYEGETPEGPFGDTSNQHRHVHVSTNASNISASALRFYER